MLGDFSRFLLVFKMNFFKNIINSLDSNQTQCFVGHVMDPKTQKLFAVIGSFRDTPVQQTTIFFIEFSVKTRLNISCESFFIPAFFFRKKGILILYQGVLSSV